MHTLFAIQPQPGFPRADNVPIPGLNDCGGVPGPVFRKIWQAFQAAKPRAAESAPLAAY